MVQGTGYQTFAVLFAPDPIAFDYAAHRTSKENASGIYSLICLHCH